MITEIRKRVSCLVAMTFTALGATAADITVSDGGANDIVGNTTWTSDNVYLLEGRVFVESGETLTIQAGTVIKGKPGSNENASALVVARGGTIMANGTAANPIIFTAEADDMADPFDLGPTDRGRWGGLIVLGAATLNSPSASGSPIVDNIEGIPTGEPRGQFGGVNDNDSSGVIRYVSIRHGGVSIGSNNEINGLTLGGVGRGTTVEFVEVYANLDDGIEFFGGTVGVKHAVVSYCGDDSFDYDQGWRGKGQFWLTIGDNAMDNGGEHDGDVDDFTKLPLSNPLIYNLTYIGPGSGAGTGGDALRMRENAAGKYYNSIFTGFGDQAVRVDSNAGARVTAGDLDIQQSLFFDFGAGSTATDIASTDAQVFFTDMAKGNAISDPMLMGIGRINDAADAFDPRLQGGSPALMAGLDEPGDGFFNDVSFKGAFDGTVNWASAWTILGETDLINDAGAAEPAYPLATGQTITVMDGGANDIKGNAVWRTGNTYLLEGRVFVEAGETLTIEPGAVIKGKPGSNENASALVVARGGKIFAEGTAANPIIFTAEADDLADPFDLGPTDRGRWGGLIVLGAATLNSPSASGTPIVDNIEGIPTGEPRGQYGGSNDNDNSGVIRYVSIRHGGVSIGSNNEINGLTLGGVGRGTTVEFVEVYANLDDGIEFFGGTVGVKYAMVAYCGDDSFDYDQGWRGKGQFWFTIGDNAMDNGGEHDGDVDDFTKTPLSNPTIYNVTYIGPGSGAGTGGDALRMRENAGGKYYNSIFTAFGDQAVRVDSNAGARVTAGDLDIQQGLFFDFGAGSLATEIASTDAQVFFTDMAKGNAISDPMLTGIGRLADAPDAMNPIPAMGSPALMAGLDEPGDGFFCDVDFKGAFGAVNWASAWTIMGATDLLSEVAAGEPNYSLAQGSTFTVMDGGANDISGSTVWRTGNTYLLEGRVFVEAGETLTIEPGVVVKGKPGSNENASALVVARGGKIFAEGTAANPIIFTAEADDLADPFDLGPTDRGRWGGLIVLGAATLNSPSASGTPIVDNIEGIPTGEPRGQFGGDNDDDDSGVIRYVSIRHGGVSIGSNNEINGLTLGGVGRGTTVEFVEVYANLDDGIEFFGGTVGVKYAVVTFCGDDSFDYDQGWRGKGQFWFTIGDNAMDNGGEHDGDVDDFTKTPLSNPTIYNVTYAGPGSGAGTGGDALRMRENAAGKYYNSIFTGFGDQAVRIDSNAGARVTAGELDIAGNIFFDFGAGSTAADIASTDAQVFFTDMSKGNRIVDPMLTGLDLVTISGLDPRPGMGSPAFTPSHVAPIGDSFFVQANFVGAFGVANWAAGWTILNEAEFLTSDGMATPVPLALGFTPAPGKLTLGFASGVGITYQLQSSPNVDGPWADVGASIAGDGAFHSFDAIIGMEPSLFYRVIEE